MKRKQTVAREGNDSQRPSTGFRMLSSSKRDKTQTTLSTRRNFPGMSVERDFPSHFKKKDSSSFISPLAIANVKSDYGGSTTGCNGVNDVLKLFRDILERMKKEEKSRGYKTNIKVHMDAIVYLRNMHKCLNEERRIGSIPDVNVGDKFLYRAALVVIGLHQKIQKGIDYLNEDGTLLATSIVDSSLYENQRRSADFLIYSGEGGNPSRNNKHGAKDQVLEGGNLALYESMKRRSPVRVIRRSSMPSLLRGTPQDNSNGSIFVYDGLYFVLDMKEVRGKQHGKRVFLFHLERMPGQIRVNQGPGMKLTKNRILSDISGGKEETKIPVMNEVDGERPSEFTYIANMNYDRLQVESISDGCNCTGQCSNCEDCSCKGKNGEEIPYDNRGNLVRKSSFIFECGSSCKCPDSCFNRVTQFGRKKELEVFKTEAKGWGVRSRLHIAPNTFICEYVGEIIEEMEIEPREIIEEEIEMKQRRLRNNEYLFRLQNFDHSSSSNRNGAFVIDASTRGNVARFINHSCSSNLFVQKVLYDHMDSRIPHIMLFSKQHIPANQELTYDYNHSLGMNCNVQAKVCKCKSPACVGRFS